MTEMIIYNIRRVFNMTFRAMEAMQYAFGNKLRKIIKKKPHTLRAHASTKV